MPEKSVSASLAINDGDTMTAEEQAGLIAWLNGIIAEIEAGNLPQIVKRRYPAGTGSGKEEGQPSKASDT